MKFIKRPDLKTSQFRKKTQRRLFFHFPPPSARPAGVWWDAKGSTREKSQKKEKKKQNDELKTIKLSKPITNKIIIFHLIFTDSFRRVKEKCFERFEFSTTFPDICINADDAKIIEFKTLIIFKLFELEVFAFVAESVKNFVDVIA